MSLHSITKLYLLSFIIGFSSCTKAQIQEPNLRSQVEIKTPIFTVLYSETKEQPITLTYKSSNRPKNVDRGSMNFYKVNGYHTSDNADYYRNVWDKGHLAPAATFSDSMENLKQTFSYLNCALQNQYLNRGQWRLLEEAERNWDNNEELVVKIDIKFSDSILPTGATLPKTFIKHIKFTKSNVYRCFSFPNERPIKDWEEYEVKHSH
jgi:DNA/RNA endonuclease G (NUC1)